MGLIEQANRPLGSSGIDNLGVALHFRQLLSGPLDGSDFGQLGLASAESPD